MGYKINPKYPLTLKQTNEDVKDLKNDIEELKNSDGGDCEFNGYPIVNIEFLDGKGYISLEPNKYYDIYAYNESCDSITMNLIFYNDRTNHYLFNLQLPFNYELRFNRDIRFINELPSLSDTGNCTISIFNGVGCFTMYDGDFNEK